MSYSLFRPFLFLLPAETAHHFSLSLLKLTHKLGLNRRCSIPCKPIELGCLSFPNPIGLAAGLDKNGDYIDALSTMGFGFIEVGTVTPRPQRGNPRPRLFRLKAQRSIINRMGFNNKGIDYLIHNVKKMRYQGILGINIGKNADTPNEHAVDDYLVCYEKAFPYADYITINISSPNTKNLRDLQHGKALTELLQRITHMRSVLTAQFDRQVPLWVKVAPDLDDEQIETLAATFNQFKIDAVIATNTLLSRTGLTHIKGIDEQGGISGELLTDKSTQVIQALSKALDPSIAVIGVGGIHNADTGLTKLDAGASLIQVYSGLVYEGPSLVKKLIKAYKDKPQ